MDSKRLVVYYSRGGVTRQVAEMIAARLECEIEGIQDVRSRKGLFGWLRSGREAMRHVLPEIRPPVRDPGQYDLVLLGTPVWASSMSSPLRTYITQNQGKFKRVAFFVTFGGSGADRALKDLADLCGQQPVATQVFKNTEVKADRHSSAVEEFILRI